MFNPTVIITYQEHASRMASLRPLKGKGKGIIKDKDKGDEDPDKNPDEDPSDEDPNDEDDDEGPSDSDDEGMQISVKHPRWQDHHYHRRGRHHHHHPQSHHPEQGGHPEKTPATDLQWPGPRGWLHAQALQHPERGHSDPHDDPSWRHGEEGVQEDSVQGGEGLHSANESGVPHKECIGRCHSHRQEHHHERELHQGHHQEHDPSG